MCTQIGVAALGSHLTGTSIDPKSPRYHRPGCDETEMRSVVAWVLMHEHVVALGVNARHPVHLMTRRVIRAT
jgi:hypothetical protein